MKTPSPAKTRKPKAATPAPDVPLAFDDDGIKRVQDIIRNARATWFALLGALVFASVTLAGVKDISFFVNTVETKLPIVGISVPVVSFFWAGSLLTAALYAYFHLYLELLWQALGDFPARDKSGALLADRIEPWIVADTALRFRDWLRGDTGDKSASRKRAMPWISGFVSLGLVWVFGLMVIFWFWWRSMPAHEPLLTLFLGAVLWVTVFVFGSSLAGAWTHLKFENHEAQRPPYWQWSLPLAFVAMFGLTFVRTAEGGWLLASADLREAVFTEKPKDWQGKEIAETEFRVRWCKERAEPKCVNPLDPAKRTFESAAEKEFQAAWKERWQAQLKAFPKPDLRGKDFRGAEMALAELEGADLRGARLAGAKLQAARLDGAILVNAVMDNANLSDALLHGAKLDGASMHEAILNSADLTAASLVGTRLNNATLKGAVLDGAILRDAKLIGADLSDASLAEAQMGRAKLQRTTMTTVNMRGADLSGANLQGAEMEYADLGGAQLLGAELEDVNLSDADMNGADLSSAKLQGAVFQSVSLQAVRLFGVRHSTLKLSAAQLDEVDLKGSGLRFAKLSKINLEVAENFDLSFGDTTVELPSGVLLPCQWSRTAMSDSEYLGHWEGWLDALGVTSHDLADDRHPPIPPNPACVPPSDKR